MERDERIKLEYVTGPNMPESRVNENYQISQAINELPISIGFDLDELVRTDLRGNVLDSQCVIQVEKCDSCNLEPSRPIVYKGLENLSSERYHVRFRLDFWNRSPALEVDDKQRNIKLRLYAAPEETVPESRPENATKGKARQLAEKILDYLRIK